MKNQIPFLRHFLAFALTIGATGFSTGMEAGQTLTEGADGIASHGTLVITSFNEVVGGLHGAQARRAPLTTQLKVAPMVKNQPDLTRAIVVTTDSDGAIKVNLDPGFYWIGPIEDTSTRLAQPGAPFVMRPAQASVEANMETVVTVVQRSFAP